MTLLKILIKVPRATLRASQANQQSGYIIILILTKILFIIYYEKKDVMELFANLKKSIFINKTGFLLYQKNYLILIKLLKLILYYYYNNY